MFHPKPRPAQPAIELAQVESQIRRGQFRLDHAILTAAERETVVTIQAALNTRAERLRDLLAWEQELAS